MSKAIVAGLIAFALVGCYGNTMGTDTGTLNVRLTNTPMPIDSVLSINVFIVRVDARLSDTDSSAAANGAADDPAVSDGWITVATPNISVNLLDYPRSNYLAIGSRRIPAGNYRGFRVIIDPSRSNVGLTNFTVLTGITVPNVSYSAASRSGIKIALTDGVRVKDEEITTLTVVFDAASSFAQRGNSITQNGLLFTPVVRAAVMQ